MYYDGNTVKLFTIFTYTMIQMFTFIHIINLIFNLIIQNKLKVEDTEQTNVSGTKVTLTFL